jgi:hypothetical protein
LRCRRGSLTDKTRAGVDPPALNWENVDQNQSPDLETGPNDDSYAGGTKEDTACPDVVDGSIPNNTDLKFFGGYHESETDGPGWLHVFWARVQDPSGTTNMDFEFNKSTTDCDGVGSSKNVVRTVALGGWITFSSS